MKSRTSYFDKTVLRKDITRFAPVWALYLIGGLIVALSLGGNSGRVYYLAQNMSQLIGPFGIISLCYAIVTAQMLFGDLFNSRLCNALHALPLRREGWFLTHCTAGLLFSFVPNLLCSLAVMPFLGKFWYAGLIWLLGMTLHYVFFFSLAVFCMLLTGNRFAAVAVYAIINFLSMIAMWFATILYEPLIYGVNISTEGFDLFSPVVGLFQKQQYFLIEHDPGCWCHNFPTWMEDDKTHVYYFAGLGSDWWYILVLFALGIGLAVAALQLYRKRHLESSGDFIAFRGVKPVFSVLYTLCVAAVLAAMEDLLNVPIYILLFVGLIIGYFTGQMLLQRNLRVFKLKNWLILALIFALILGSMGLVQEDVFGIERWVPEKDEVVSVKIANQRVTEFNDYNLDAEITDPAVIEEILRAHELMIAEGPTEDRDYQTGWNHVTLCYKLKNGREVYRQYRPGKDSVAMNILNKLIFQNPTYVLKADNLETLQNKVLQLRVEGILFQGAQKDKFVAALWEDAQEGTLMIQSEYFDKESPYVGYVELIYREGYSLYLDIFESNRHTAQLIKKSLMDGISPNDLMNCLSHVQIGHTILDWDDPLEDFCKAFCKELESTILEGHHYEEGTLITLHLHSGRTQEYTVPVESPFYAWIIRNLPDAVVKG